MDKSWDCDADDGGGKAYRRDGPQMHPFEDTDAGEHKSHLLHVEMRYEAGPAFARTSSEESMNCDAGYADGDGTPWELNQTHLQQYSRQVRQDVVSY